MFTVNVDRASGIPLYLQIKEQILYEISVNSLPAGTILPSIRQLASQLNVSSVTVRHAYEVLERDGFVVTHQGKGVLVAELTANMSVERAEYQDQVLSLFSAAVARARALGLSLSEVKAIIAEAMSHWKELPKVLFIGGEAEFNEHYTPLIRQALTDLPVEVSSLLLNELVQHPETIWQQLSRPLCVVTLVRSYSAVREICDRFRIPVSALALSLSEETRAELMQLSRDSNVVLVAEHGNLMGFFHLAAQYVVTDKPLQHQSAETDDLRASVGDADIVIHSLRVRRIVESQIGDSARRVELHFVPDPMSLSRVRETVVSRLAEATEEFSSDGLSFDEMSPQDAGLPV